ncbi:hypothetical protein NPX13_g2947 [Xylaria arbuscula]|uniref:Heterokaryon incompatibility domain-containing protein n=1 Tax=Xylaria arbuscula TaxID=114810 RepID=A0A9W8NIQ7_9PEZI|nr:hypothetical protein NPX13_g2947 [Xylaria arbuscula]
MEKSLQVRMMKHVYSAAYQTFAWLGEPRADGAAAAIASMRSASHELPQQTDGINTMPQECVCAASASSDETHNQDILPCHICQTKSTFQNIENLFNQGYWQRRWIVQEIAASARVRFGCGKEIIDLQKLQETVVQHEKSSYWKPANDTACRHFRKIASLRHRQYVAGTLTLCHALVKTQEFMSKDARDRLYAVVGIGYDGPDLIPNIDYRQSDNEIARDFTRSLIRRNGCFDIITADRSRDFRSDGLPSWSPNWLSGNLPSDEHFQECTRPRSSFDGLPTGSPNWLLGNSPRDEHFDEYLRPDEPTRTRPLLLSHEFRQRCLDGHPNTLVTEGLLIGTIDRMTSAINEGSNLENIGSGFGRSQTGSGVKSMEYYGGSKKLLTGLLRCLLIRKEDWWQVKSCEYGDSLVCKHSGKLVLCDTGMLAMSSQYSEIGDHICLLAGCATPVVVRRKPGGSPWVDPQRRVYEVVGSALVSLSERDREPLLAFIGDRERLRPFYYQFYEAENGLSWYEREISKLRKHDDWQEFVLV